MTQRTVRFPDGFCWGASTSAHQVEGGNRWNDWWRFEHRTPDIPPSRQSGEACRHYELFDRDFALAAADGHDTHRLSIEWSRIEPEPGHIDDAAVAHYHEVFDSLRRHGLRPVVTLLHFTVPTWIANRGSWESRDTIEHYCAFVRRCAREYGAQVDWWCTINEPEVIAFRGWSEGLWPPNKRDASLAVEVIANQLEAHGRAYRILHEEDRVDADGDGHAARVGFAKNYVQLEPLRAWSPLDRAFAYFQDRVFNEAVIAAPVTGVIDLGFPGARSVRRVLPELERSLDWFGLNYYTRWTVNATNPKSHGPRPGAQITDLGWEIYPEGLALAVRRAAATGLPVLVTEHGFADAQDVFRPRALVDSLTALGDAVNAGANVIGYLHWSLMDNFEWAEGWPPRFGLYRVNALEDPSSRERTHSAEVYARIIRANAITPEIAEFAEPSTPPVTARGSEHPPTGAAGGPP